MGNFSEREDFSNVESPFQKHWLSGAINKWTFRIFLSMSKTIYNRCTFYVAMSLTLSDLIAIVTLRVHLFYVKFEIQSKFPLFRSIFAAIQRSVPMNRGRRDRFGLILYVFFQTKLQKTTRQNFCSEKQTGKISA